MFKAVEALLEAGKIEKEAAEKLDAEISAALKELRDENAKIRNEKKQLSEALEEVKGSKAELESQMATLDERIKKAKEEGKSELAQQLEAERAEKEKLKASMEQIEAKNRDLLAKSTLQKVLSGYDPINARVVSIAMEQNLFVEDGAVKYRDGESILSVEDGVKKFFEANPEMLKSKGSAGSGANPGGASWEGKKFSEMTLTERTELKKKDPARYEQLKKQGA